MELIDWGEIVPAIPNEPGQERLREILQACMAHPDFDVVGLRRIDGPPEHFAIIVDVGDGAVAPGNSVGIRRRERLALIYRSGADMPPEVRALRRDFPDTLHQNGVESGQPRSLCLYEPSWTTVERSWTPQAHLRQLLRWLEKTADGTLHEGDQALEQLFFSTGEQVVVPAELARPGGGKTGPFRVTRTVMAGNRATMIVERLDGTSAAHPGLDLLQIALAPISHLPIQSPPHTLAELEARLQAMGTSLFPSMLEVVRTLGKGGIALAPREPPRRVLLLASIPRVHEGQVQRVDVRGFIVEIDLARLGMALGVLQLQGNKAYSFQILPPDTTPVLPTEHRWRDYKLYPVDVRFSPDRALAQAISGVSATEAEFRGVLAGTGALGSVMAELWSREGWGQWDLVDPDTLEPHNPIRHVGAFRDVGQAKAELVRARIDALLDTPGPQGAAIVARANAVQCAEVEAALLRAQLLVDATTTIDVPRDLSEREGPRIASAFLTPSGLAAVLLLEDDARAIRVSSLEAQYYRALLQQPWGRHHLDSVQSLRVGAGCRDRSFVLSDELIHLHAAQLARRIRRGVAEPGAQIALWSLDDATGEVTCESMLPAPMQSVQCGAWQVRWDAALEAQLEAARRAAFPAETGGVLVGVIDHKLRTIHLVDGWPAPADSQADESGFTRGKLNVLEAVQECRRLTRDMVGYVGEWHSHPPGLANTPSMLDVELLATLTLQLSADGVPAVMAIAGENGLGVTLGQVLTFAPDLAP